jgi:K+-transporting ATPase ATPase C chain
MRTATSLFLCLCLLTGIVYPLAITAYAAIFHGSESRGALIQHDGRAIGSERVGQEFHSPQYFWGRLSATGPRPYVAFDPTSSSGSSGSNYGPLHPALLSAARARIEALRAAERRVGAVEAGAIPIELVTASGSGLDPHIGLSAARYQVPRVALARGLSIARVEALVAECTDGRQLGFLGEPVVHVLRLNLALDRESGAVPSR